MVRSQYIGCNAFSEKKKEKGLNRLRGDFGYILSEFQIWSLVTAGTRMWPLRLPLGAQAYEEGKLN